MQFVLATLAFALSVAAMPAENNYGPPPYYPPPSYPTTKTVTVTEPPVTTTKTVTEPPVTVTQPCGYNPPPYGYGPPPY